MAVLHKEAYLHNITAEDLLKMLHEIADDPTEIPSSAAALGKRLRMTETSLETQGVRIRPHRSSTERMMTITFGEPDQREQQGA